MRVQAGGSWHDPGAEPGSRDALRGLHHDPNHAAERSSKQEMVFENGRAGEHRPLKAWFPFPHRVCLARSGRSDTSFCTTPAPLDRAGSEVRAAAGFQTAYAPQCFRTHRTRPGPVQVPPVLLPQAWHTPCPSEERRSQK